jgi:hypothetical protein
LHFAAWLAGTTAAQALLLQLLLLLGSRNTCTTLCCMCCLCLLVLLLGLLDAVQQQGLQLVAAAKLSSVGCSQLPQLPAFTLQCLLQLLEDSLTAGASRLLHTTFRHSIICGTASEAHLIDQVSG